MNLTNIPENVQKCILAGDGRNWWVRIEEKQFKKNYQAIALVLAEKISKHTTQHEDCMGEGYTRDNPNYVLTSDDEYRYIGVTKRTDRQMLTLLGDWVEVPPMFIDPVFRVVS